MPPLDALRAELASLDREILERVARRRAIASEIGEVKRACGLPTRDFTQEKEVEQRARRIAAELALPPALVKEMVGLLVRTALTIQEQERVAAGASGRGRRALVIGGSGRMGAWFARFLSSQGFAVVIADPAESGDAFPRHADWRALALDEDVVVVAAPLRATAAILEELAVRKPPGLVFDVGSLKSPLRNALLALAAAGVKVTSLHPMFGPDVELLSGRHVVFIDLRPDATREARALFDPTLAVQVEMDLDAHDRLVAYVLGLSHAVNVAFFGALAASGEDALELARLSSTTFDAQLAIAARVAAENAHLYYEIQALNDYRAAPLEALSDAVARLRRSIESGDEAAFVALFERARAWLEGSPPG